MQKIVLKKAKCIVSVLQDISHEKNLWWTTPLINFTEDFVIILEWWHYNKKVMLYITQELIEYVVCGEGKDGVYKVQCGKLKSDTELRNIWVWLASVDFARELEEKSASISEEDAKEWREIILSEVKPGFPDF